MREKHPLAVARRVASLTDSAIVFYSTGRDSDATLDLCWHHFRRVVAVFMFIVPGLSFKESAIRRVRTRYKGLEVLQVPHWALSRLLRSATLRDESKLSSSLPSLKFKDVEAYVRQQTGIEWVAQGAKAVDSLERRGMVTRCQGVDEGRKRFYPLAWWNNRAVGFYLKQKRIPLAADYSILGRSYDGTLYGDELRSIKEHFPADFELIAERFPHVRAEVMRSEQTGEQPVVGWGRQWDIDARADEAIP